MEFISDWVQTIIVAVAVATIIEMILPNGNSKKYIKMVLGIFIVFNIVSPLISKITGTNLKISEIVNLEKYIDKASAYEIYDSSLEKNNQSNIKEVYILNLKKDMKSKIEEKGYNVINIQIQADNNEEYTINKVALVISKKQDSEIDKSSIIEIEKVQINQIQISDIEKESDEVKKEDITNNEIKEIKDFINSTYNINKNVITIN